MLPLFEWAPEIGWFQIMASMYLVLSFVSYINFLMLNLVSEKEKKIKEGMRMMGLKDAAFWWEPQSLFKSFGIHMLALFQIFMSLIALLVFETLSQHFSHLPCLKLINILFLISYMSYLNILSYLKLFWGVNVKLLYQSLQGEPCYIHGGSWKLVKLKWHNMWMTSNTFNFEALK